MTPSRRCGRRRTCARAGLLAALALAWSALPAHEIVPGPPQTPATRLHWHAYRVFSSNDGLPQNTVYAVAQDRRGYVYAGTEAGLARYDADAWLPIRLPGDGVARAVGALTVDAGDGLWIGTSSGLWWRGPDDAGARLLAQPDPRQTIFDLDVDGDTVWVSAGDGLYRCSAPQRCEVVAATRGKTVARTLRGRRGGRPVLWVGVEGEGLYRLDEPQRSDAPFADFKLTRDDGLPNNSVRSLVQWGGAQSEDLWIGTGRGLVRYDGARLVRYTAANGFPAGMVWALEPTGDESNAPALLVGVRPGGLVVMRDDGRWTLETVAQGLPENFVASLHRTRAADGSAQLWVGTVSSGLARREPGRWRRFDERDDLPDRVAIGVGALGARTVPRRAGATIWIGTMRGAVQWHEGAWQPLLPEPFRKRLVRDALRDADGVVWAATERGLLRVAGDAAHEFTPDDSEVPAVGTDLLVRRVASNGEEEVWVGTGHGLARWRASDGVRLVTPAPGTERDAVQALAVTRDGAASYLWVGRDTGLLRFDGSHWQAVGGGCGGRRLGEIVALLPHRVGDDEHLWIAGRLGIAHLRREDALQCTPVDVDLAPATFAAMALDQRARLYLFTTAGVARARFAGDAASAPELVSLERFGLEDGLPAVEFHGGRGAWRDDEGRIWAASAAGLVAYDPADETAPAGPAPLELVAAASVARGVPLREGVELAADDADVVFDYRLLSYEREHQIRYRTELAGIEVAPRAWSRDNHAAYSRLPPGRYTFRVWGRDAHGSVSGPVARHFTVLAPLWLRSWALAGYALLLIGLGLAVGRWRQQSLRRRAQALEAEVAARTHELAEANRRLEEASLTDPLTGLGNRRVFTVEVEHEGERTLRRYESGERHADLLLALIDIDHFKSINDRYGHDGGDAVLVEIGRRLRAFQRKGDFALRWGGEEFLLVLRDSDRAALPDLVRRLLALVAETPVATPAGAVMLTVSIGAVAFPLQPDAPRARSLTQLVPIADRALYRAKNAGRDCAYVVSWDATASAGEPDLGLRWQRVTRVAATDAPAV